MLHVTNGESVSLRESGLGGEVLCWSDVLHEGPVPAGLDPLQLRRIRGLFLDEECPREVSAIDELARRDEALENFARHDEVVLWFEHDLHDQLQLVQILDRLRGLHNAAARLSLICIDRYLGWLTGPELAFLWPQRHAVTAAEMDLACTAWQAFCSADPVMIEELLRRDTSALPFLAAALLRHLQQFPSVESGLARTERQILEAIRTGRHTFGSLFPAVQQMEERIFMGDSSLQRYVRGLAQCRHPLLQAEDGVYSLTSTGQDVLAGRADQVHLNGINRWLGGVHLMGSEVLWRWDQRVQQLLRH